MKAPLPAVGQTFELVKTPEPSMLGRRVTIIAIVGGDWYEELFGEPRCCIRMGVYLLPGTLASRYKPVAA